MSDAHRDEIAKLETLYAQNPEGRIFTHLAEALRKGGSLERARDVLAEGIERHPDYSSAHVVLGRVLVDLGDHDQARSEFRRVLELDPHNLVALRSLGDIARAEGREQEALEYYERLLDQEPSDDEVREIIAVMTGAAPAPEDEAQVLEPAAEEEPFPAAEDEDLVEGGLVEEEPVEEPAPAAEEVGAADEIEAADEPEAPSELVTPWSTGEDLVEEEEAAEEPEEERAEAPWATESDAGEEGEEEPWAVAGDLEDEWSSGTGETETWGVGEGVVGFEEDEAAPEEQEGEPELEEIEDADVMTETIAQVYARQGLYDRAVEVYEELIRSRPEDEGLRERLAEIEAQAAAEAEADRTEAIESDTVSEADADEGGAAEEIEPWAAEYAWDEDETETEEPVLDVEPEEADEEMVPEVEDHPDGFEAAELVTSPDEEIVPIEGLEAEEVEPETGLAVTPEDVEAEEAGLEEAGAEEAEEYEPWAQGADEDAAVEAAEPEEPAPWEVQEEEEGAEAEELAAEVGPHESPWMEEDWSRDQEAETPYAWATEDEESEDASPPIHDYLQGLLGWGGDAGADAAGATSDPGPDGPAPEAGPEAGARGAPDPSGDDDDDLETFRSWLESLKE